MSNFTSILVAIDLNHEDKAKHLLGVAGRMAKTNGANLHVLTVVPDFSMPIVGSYFPADFEQNATAKIQEKLNSFVAANAPSDVNATKQVAHGAVYEAVIKAADAKGTDMIVIGSLNPGLQEFLLGTNAARVVRHAKQSVMVIRN